MSDDERKIHELFDGADRALMAADIEKLAQVFADPRSLLEAVL